MTKIVLGVYESVKMWVWSWQIFLRNCECDMSRIWTRQTCIRIWRFGVTRIWSLQTNLRISECDMSRIWTRQSWMGIWASDVTRIWSRQKCVVICAFWRAMYMVATDIFRNMSVCRDTYMATTNLLGKQCMCVWQDTYMDTMKLFRNTVYMRLTWHVYDHDKPF